jgi:hypothetical protein
LKESCAERVNNHQKWEGIKMTIQKGIWLCIIVWLFVPFQMLHAGQCDDVYAKAKGIHKSAEEAVNQKDYTRAAELYREALKYYEQAANMRDCN